MLALLCASSAALAHDPPQGTGIFEQGSSILIRTNRGLILSANGKTDFRLLCNEALGINTAEVPSIVPLSSGRWLLATSHGAMIAAADLCTFEPVAPIDTVAVPALSRDPGSADRILASTGQSDYDNGLFLSTDGAETFSAYGDRDRNRLYDALVVAASDPQRVFASGLRIHEGVNGFEHFFAASSDAGEHFVEHPFVLHDDEYAIEVLGVAPDASAVYAVAHADLGTGVKDRFLVSNDAAKTFRDALSVDKLEALAVDAATGSIVIGARDGLWRSRDRGTTFEQLQRVAVHCVAWAGQRLYVCDDQASGAGLSSSDDAGETLSRIMSFTDVVSTVACGEQTTAHTACLGPWLDWQRELSVGFRPDGGLPGADAAAADGGTTTVEAGPDAAMGPDEARSGCSCTTLRGSRPARLNLLLLQLFALACVARRRRMRHRAGATESVLERGELR